MSKVIKVVVFLDEKEFNGTRLGNKAVYRTRIAIADRRFKITYEVEKLSREEV